MILPSRQLVKDLGFFFIDAGVDEELVFASQSTI